MKKPLLLCAFVLTSTPFLSGCITQRIMDSEDRKVYTQYRITAEQNNLEREKAGLKPAQIPTFDEWRGTGKK